MYYNTFRDRKDRWNVLYFTNGDTIINRKLPG